MLSGTVLNPLPSASSIKPKASKDPLSPSRVDESKKIGVLPYKSANCEDTEEPKNILQNRYSLIQWYLHKTKIEKLKIRTTGMPRMNLE